MPQQANIPLRLIAPQGKKANNQKGDLFTRLMKDLFFALGYKDLQVDVAKSGREIDIQGLHKTEQRGVRAECKAYAKPIGGDVINKMRGVLQAEQAQSDVPLCAYVVALNRFTANAIEEEKKLPIEQQAILLGNEQIVAHLIESSIVISPTKATEIAGRIASHNKIDAQLDNLELLGHDKGYIWAVYYSHNKIISHVALIHADGTPLSKDIAKGLDLDKNLQQLQPPAPTNSSTELKTQAKQQYLHWLNKECGEIHLDGLPADADLSVYSLELEKLFVPLNLQYQLKDQNQQFETIVQPVGKYFSENNQFSLLAKPGGGKSTLLKRIAVAYADKTRFTAVADKLPNIDYLPLLLRCRDLKTRAGEPILSLIQHLATSANLTSSLQSSFNQLIEQQLNHGQVLLLIDGLDEIASESLRATFASNLRSFLATFPQLAMIITSREAGYRHVASVIASSCPQVTMADFDQNDVTNLCLRWHHAVLGEDDKITAQAQELANTIWQSDRVRALAENPLMLTTLLVIKRCIGELPTKRVELYRQAAEVLIRTWNTQGFEPMDLDEALAQLCYVACAMMEAGIQRVGHKQLVKWLQQARDKMPAELGYCTQSPAQFIERIEYRSSLLMRVGSDEIDGTLQDVYEFRHLTFQEYLTARGLVEYGYPQCDGPQNLTAQLKGYLFDESWQQVIPLAAVMAKNKAAGLIDMLTQQLQQADYDENELEFLNNNDRKAQQLLLQCLLDEVQINPELVKTAIAQAFRHNDNYENALKLLTKGKFNNLVEQTITSLYLSPTGLQYCEAYFSLIEFERKQQNSDANALLTSSINQLDIDLESILAKCSPNNIATIKPILILYKSLIYCGLTFYDINHQNLNKNIDKSILSNINGEQVYKALTKLLIALSPSIAKKYPNLLLTIMFAIGWFVRSKLLPYKSDKTVLLQFLNLATACNNAFIANLCCINFIYHQPLNRTAFNQNQKHIQSEKQTLIRFFEQLTHMAQASNYQSLSKSVEGLKLVLGWYHCFEVSDNTLISQIEQYLKDNLLYKDAFEPMLAALKANLTE